MSLFMKVTSAFLISGTFGFHTGRPAWKASLAARSDKWDWLMLGAMVAIVRMEKEEKGCGLVPPAWEQGDNK